jgi:STE24 endopeptidase
VGIDPQFSVGVGDKLVEFESMVLAIAAALIVVRFLVELWLEALNRAEVRRHATTPPPAAAAIMDNATYAKSVAYTLAKSRFGAVSGVFDTLVLILVVFGGVLPALFAFTSTWAAPAAMWDDALFLILSGVLLSIPGLPFDWWSQFRIEQNYGFNRSSTGLWVADKFKGLLLALALGFPLLWLLLMLVEWTGAVWWLWAAGVLLGFQLLMMVLYPKLILPLFNKLTPLPEGPLRTRLMALAEKAGFQARTIDVIDGSKRSGHSNAYFTGFGRFRRIVLYDTLIAQLTPEELEAVLAHEIGHYRLGHIPRMLLLSTVFTVGGFFAIAWLTDTPEFNEAFGFPAFEQAPSFLLFGLLSGTVTFWLSPLTNLLSRKHEYQADAFARDAVGGSAPMIGALRKLAQKNLSNLTPHPWYSAFHYSHPTIAERERALGK